MKLKKIFGIAVMAIVASSIFIPSNSSNIPAIIPSIYSESLVEATAGGPDRPRGYHWIQATNNAVWLWNPEPGDGETITWSGEYISIDGIRYANGYGTVVWRRYGEVVQIDEGTFTKGRHHGRFKHTFPKSGRVEYSYLENGVEVG